MAKSIEKATKLGVANWAKTGNNIDVHVVNGNTRRTRQVYLEFIEPQDAEDFKAEIAEAFEKFKVTSMAEGNEFDERFPATLGYEVKKGKLLFKFWTYSEYPATKDKPAQPKNLPVSIVGKGALADDESIGNGSKIQVAYELSPYWSSKKGFGVSLNMTQILVHEHIKFGGNRDANDLSVFGVTNVFSEAVAPKVSSAPSSDIAPEEIPF